MPVKRKAVKRPKRPKKTVKKTIRGKGVVDDVRKTYKKHKKKIIAGASALGALGLGLAYVYNVPNQSALYKGGFTGRSYAPRGFNGSDHPLFTGIMD